MTKSRMRVEDFTSDTRWRTAGGTLVLAIVFLFALVTPRLAHAQTFTVLHVFTRAGDGVYPGDVVLDNQGNLYGSTYQGGSFNYGIVFKLDSNGKETLLHDFVGADGLGAGTHLLRDAAGNLYGTTFSGGTPEGAIGCRFGCGTIFELDKASKETLLYAFSSWSYGTYPGGLVRDDSGNFYGTTQGGGQDHWGFIFRVDHAGKLTVLHQFTGGADGGLPYGTLIRDAQGALYGTTIQGGGSCGCGVVFKIDKAGKETVLYSFTGGADGAFPLGGLVRDSEGNLYGTASRDGDMSCGGGAGCGTVFQLDKTGKMTVLHTFSGLDGEYPQASLVLDPAGDLYGTTSYGGTGTSCDLFYYAGCGIIFKLDTSGQETVLYNFTGGADGREPAGLFLDATGNLYGSTGVGGGNGGVVFKLIP